MNHRFHLYIFFFAFSLPLFSQVSSTEIDQIKSEIAKYQFKSAEKKLRYIYYKDKSNIEVSWLLAYSLFQLGNNIESKEMYEKTMQLLPDSNELKLEYTQVLYRIGNLKKAEDLLAELKQTNLEQSTILLLDAEIKFWKADYAEANNILAALDKLYPDNKSTLNLKKKIAQAKTPNIQLGTSISDDNQPLQSLGFQLGIGKMTSYLLYPTLQVKNNTFSNDAQIWDVQLSNQSQFIYAGMGTEIKIGAHYNNISDKTNFTGGASLTKNIGKKIKLTLGAERLSYNNTAESTLTDLFFYKGNAVLEVGNYEKALLHIGYDYSLFDDENVIQSFGAWYISKPLFKSTLKMQLGYGLGFSDSKNSTFYPTAYNTSNNLSGKYNLYYTPNNQYVNSVVVVVNYPFTKKLKATAKANYGFYATANNPVYSVSSENNSEITYSEVKTKFNPVDAGFNLQYTASSKWSLKSQISYFKTYFYDCVNGGISVDYKF